MEHANLVIIQVLATFAIGLPLIGYAVKRIFDLF